MAAQLQPSGMDATESNFVFYPDNDKVGLGLYKDTVRKLGFLARQEAILASCHQRSQQDL